MQILEHLGLALGLATLAGVNLYLTVFLTGLAVRFNWVQLAEQHQVLDVLAHPVVLIVAGLMFLMEFLADKIPWIDSLWDSVHTFIRPVGGVLLGLQVLGDMPVYIQVVAALLAGGAALTTHTAKAGTRLAVNHSPEPVSNVTLSVAEDAAVTGGVFLSLMHPVVALIVFSSILVILWLILPKIWRSSKATMWLIWNKMKMPGKRHPLAAPIDLKPAVMDDPVRDLLNIHGGVKEEDIRLAVRCLSARCKGVRGLVSNLRGVLVLTHKADCLYFAATKGLRDRLFKVPLTGATARIDARFLSDNLVVEGSNLRAVFRFHRGQAEVAESVAMRLQEVLVLASAAAEAREASPVRDTTATPAAAASVAIVAAPVSEFVAETTGPTRSFEPPQPRETFFSAPQPASLSTAPMVDADVLPPTVEKEVDLEAMSGPNADPREETPSKQSPGALADLSGLDLPDRAPREEADLDDGPSASQDEDKDKKDDPPVLAPFPIVG